MPISFLQQLTAFSDLLLLGASWRQNLFLNWCPTTIVKSGRGYSRNSKTLCPGLAWRFYTAQMVSKDETCLNTSHHASKDVHLWPGRCARRKNAPRLRSSSCLCPRWDCDASSSSPQTGGPNLLPVTDKWHEMVFHLTSLTTLNVTSSHGDRTVFGRSRFFREGRRPNKQEADSWVKWGCLGTGWEWSDGPARRWDAAGGRPDGRSAQRQGKREKFAEDSTRGVNIPLTKGTWMRGGPV